MKNITEIFGSNVFNDHVMKERLPKDIYVALKATINKGVPLGSKLADVVANALKDWAVEKGATHYTHWFQPLTGSTAEKHDSFISPTPDGGIVMEFSGKQLSQGEPDASSFPHGGLRTTFEARGYTAWDCTSPAFLKEDAAGDVTLYIPTAFCSYTGEALDKKTPLLRSMAAVSKQAIRVLKVLGNKKSTRVTSTVGPEQEYFLVDKKYFAERLDLIVSGRTLFGAPAPKGQEMEDHYFGQIKDRVADFMKDLDSDLWKMGITAKTKHNEVAPSQFELAPVFATANIATDHNQLIMETMEKVALRHGLVCLLHEKPYVGVNGSGKHNNWSLATDDNINLLKPGSSPHENTQFLMFLSAIIMATDKHADVLRFSAATSGNDHRLGANEAPPAIISIFLGDKLTTFMEDIAAGRKSKYAGGSDIKVGVNSLPPLPKDNTDRNRTSPLTFTGDKFEFRMVGSSASIAEANVALNIIVAETLDEIATRLEKAHDINQEAVRIVRDVMKKHGRIIFNGNNYSKEWVKEAEKRGLPNTTSSVAAYASFNTKKNLDLFEKYNVLSKEEFLARIDIYLEQYSKQINIEAQASIDMVKSLYIPVVIEYTHELADSINSIKKTGADVSIQQKLLKEVTDLLNSTSKKLNILEKKLTKAQSVESDVLKQAKSYRDDVFTAMNDLRCDIDSLETIVPRYLWPVPTYADLLFKL